MHQSHLHRTGAFVAAALLAGCTTAVAVPRVDAPLIPQPPTAEQRPIEVRAPHGATRVDEYHWLRERENTAVAVAVNVTASAPVTLTVS